MLERLYELDLLVLCPAIIAMIFAAAKIGSWAGRRAYGAGRPELDIGTVTGAALGLLALLLGFSFSLALSRHDARRLLVIEEANAIGSTANFALMLPESAQRPVLDGLREYTAVRLAFAVPFDFAKLERDAARSVELQAMLWQHAVAVSTAAPQSLAVNNFVRSLSEMINVHERRYDSVLYRVPSIIMVMLVGVAMVAMGFTGLQIGLAGTSRPVPILVMSTTLALVITLIADIDRPTRGLVNVPLDPLDHVAASLPR